MVDVSRCGRGPSLYSCNCVLNIHTPLQSMVTGIPNLFSEALDWSFRGGVSCIPPSVRSDVLCYDTALCSSIRRNGEGTSSTIRQVSIYSSEVLVLHFGGGGRGGSEVKLPAISYHIVDSYYRYRIVPYCAVMY